MSCVWALVTALLFQSTPSAWRETLCCFPAVSAVVISIHSLRMEGDLCRVPPCGAGNISIHSLRMEGDHYRRSCSRRRMRYFNPLPPHGGRPKMSYAQRLELYKFQSTPSAWRETHQRTAGKSLCAQFQSTPSAWRETVLPQYPLRVVIRFQSTPSAWRETKRLCGSLSALGISIHSLRMEGDLRGNRDKF